MVGLNLRPFARSRTAATAPASSPASTPSKKGWAIAIAALVVVAAVAGIYYFAVYNKPSSGGGFSERVKIDIGGFFYNSTDPSNSVPAAYYPPNFNVSIGATVNLVIRNTDNMTHGLAVPGFNIDTGAMAPNATKILTFVASRAGNYTYTEPNSDCGGGTCDSNETLADLTGWFLVTS
jgi:heme/copper-type cytochrome/quinol oxidase subunit 2